MDRQQFTAFILARSRPELAKLNGMVYQVWEDGEITLQKSGELLGQRNLHCISPGCENGLPLDYFPTEERKYGHNNIFTDQKGAEEIRLEILKRSLDITRNSILAEFNDAVLDN